LFKLRFRLNCDGPWPRANYTTALAAVFDIAFPRDTPADTVSDKDRRIRWTPASASNREDGFPMFNPPLFSHPISSVHLPVVSPSRVITMHVKPTRFRFSSDDGFRCRYRPHRGELRSREQPIAPRALKGHRKFMTARQQ